MPINVTTHDGTEELLTTKEAMAELGIGRTAFYRYVRTHEIETVRHGGRTYVPRSVLTAYWTRLRDDSLRRKKARQRRAAR